MYVTITYNERVSSNNGETFVWEFLDECFEAIFHVYEYNTLRFFFKQLRIDSEFVELYSFCEIHYLFFTWQTSILFRIS